MKEARETGWRMKSIYNSLRRNVESNSQPEALYILNNQQLAEAASTYNAKALKQMQIHQTKPQSVG